MAFGRACMIPGPQISDGRRHGYALDLGLLGGGLLIGLAGGGRLRARAHHDMVLVEYVLLVPGFSVWTKRALGDDHPRWPPVPDIAMLQALALWSAPRVRSATRGWAA